MLFRIISRWLPLVWLSLQFCLCATVGTDNRSTIALNLNSVTRREDSFRCYVCFWSSNNESCGDANFSLHHSEAGKFMFGCLACYKQVLYNADGEKTKILRGCAQESPYYALTCQNIYNKDGSFQQTCACSSEYCNGAPYTDVATFRMKVALVTSIGLLTSYITWR